MIYLRYFIFVWSARCVMFLLILCRWACGTKNKITIDYHNGTKPLAYQIEDGEWHEL